MLQPDIQTLLRTHPSILRPCRRRKIKGEEEEVRSPSPTLGSWMQLHTELGAKTIDCSVKRTFVDACWFNLFLVGGKGVTLSPRFILPLMFLVLLVSFSSLLFPSFSFLFSPERFPFSSLLRTDSRRRTDGQRKEE